MRLAFTLGAHAFFGVFLCFLFVFVCFVVFVFFWRRRCRPGPPPARTTDRRRSGSFRCRGRGRTAHRDCTGCRRRRDRPPCGTTARRCRSRACCRCLWFCVWCVCVWFWCG